MSLIGYWTFAADGSGTYTATDRANGPMEMAVYGTWGGGTITVQWSPNGGDTSVALNNSVGTPVSLTADGAISPINMVQGDMIRPVLTGATAPTLTVKLRSIM
jgi:hypothetical protein